MAVFSFRAGPSKDFHAAAPRAAGSLARPWFCVLLPSAHKTNRIEPGMPWDALGCLGMPWDALGCLGMPWDALGCLGIENVTHCGTVNFKTPTPEVSFSHRGDPALRVPTWNFEVLWIWHISRLSCVKLRITLTATWKVRKVRALSKTTADLIWPNY